MLLFNIGRRNCVGQELAKKQLYLVIGILIYLYEFEIPKKYKTKEEYKIPTNFFDVSHTPLIGVVAKKRRHQE